MNCGELTKVNEEATFISRFVSLETEIQLMRAQLICDEITYVSFRLMASRNLLFIPSAINQSSVDNLQLVTAT